MAAKQTRHRLCLHGLAVTLDLSIESPLPEIDRMIRPFQVSEWPEGFVPICGRLGAFNYAEISRSLSPAATSVAGLDHLIELYQDGETYWLVDDRWGMTEINLLKNQWRSWLLPHPSMHPVCCVDSALLWPMAQLLRQRGVELLPAVSVERNGWGALIIAPYGVEPELRRLMRAGYRIIGQRWTAMRQEDQNISLLHLPGQVERSISPAIGGAFNRRSWIDLTSDLPWSSANHAICQAVLIIDPGRRSTTRGRELSPAAASAALRHAWPIIRLPVNRRLGGLPMDLARQCHCVSVQLSRREDDFLTLLESLRHRPNRPRLELTLPARRTGKSAALRPAMMSIR